MKTTSVATIVSAANVAEMGTPQQKIILQHLRERRDHGLSQYEATNLYRIAALPRRIADLQERGVPIRKVRRKDPTGRCYVRYFLDASFGGSLMLVLALALTALAVWAVSGDDPDCRA